MLIHGPVYELPDERSSQFSIPFGLWSGWSLLEVVVGLLIDSDLVPWTTVPCVRVSILMHVSGKVSVG